jgi:hypothetical protein
MAIENRKSAIGKRNSNGPLPMAHCFSTATQARDRIDRMIPYGRRLKFAFRTFFSILDHSRIPDDVASALGMSTPEREEAPAPVVPESTDRALQMLAILQRDGRLVDFLMEDLGAYQDAQIGAAARDVHAGCRKALTRYVALESVLDDEEGQTVTVDRAADPSSVKVVGSVAGAPPYRGVLRHRGWRATRVDLPPLAAAGRTILAPAEVEVS